MKELIISIFGAIVVAICYYLYLFSFYTRVDKKSESEKEHNSKELLSEDELVVEVLEFLRKCYEEAYDCSADLEKRLDGFLKCYFRSGDYRFNFRKNFKKLLDKSKMPKSQFFDFMKNLDEKKDSYQHKTQFTEIKSYWNKLKKWNRYGYLGVAHSSIDKKTLGEYFFQEAKADFREILDDIRKFLKRFFKRNSKLGEIFQNDTRRMLNLKKESEKFFSKEEKYILFFNTYDSKRFVKICSNEEKEDLKKLRKKAEKLNFMVKMIQFKIQRGDFKSMEQFNLFYECFYGVEKIEFFGKFLKEPVEFDKLDIAVLDMEQNLEKIMSKVIKK